MLKNIGFTLIEIMIVVSIVGILSAIALRSYNSYIVGARRTDAYISLTLAAAEQERIFSTTLAYVSDLSKLGGDKSPGEYYSIGVTLIGSGYKLSAIPVSGKGQEQDTDCLLMTIDNFGVKLPVKCW